MEAAALGRLTIARLALRVEAQRMALDRSKGRLTDAGLRAIGIEQEAPDAEANEPEDTRPRHARNGVEPRPDQHDDDEDDDTAPSGAEDAAPQDQDAPAPEAAHALPTPASRANLRDAAQSVLAAWDDDANQCYDLADATDAMRQILAKPSGIAREPGAPRKPREGTKQETVLALLGREEGMTIAQICEATGWQQHTARGFFAGLKKRQGIEVQVLEYLRQVGPNKEGARVSYSIYNLPA
jgi:hypothetical protein